MMLDFGIKDVVFDPHVGETRLLWDAGGRRVGWYWTQRVGGGVWGATTGEGHRQARLAKRLITDSPPRNAPFMYCRACKERYSANAADYWGAPQDYVFTCCERPLVLAREAIAVEEI